MDNELASLPLNPLVSDGALMIQQDESPNQEVHKRVKRLVANKPRFETVSFDDKPSVQRACQEAEDGLKALYNWMNRGKTTFDWKITQFQQGDGLGIGKAIFVPGHGDVLGNYDSDEIEAATTDEGDTYRDTLSKLPLDDEDRKIKAYDTVTEMALMKELPPFRLVAVDPLTCYWFEDDDGIEILAEVGEKTLNPLLAAFEDEGLRYDSSKKRLYVTSEGSDVVGAGTTQQMATSDLSTRVTYVEIRTRTKIAILIEHPKIDSRVQGSSDEKGVILTFDNPFGPYTTGYVLVPADVTTEDDEADKYQPPVLASINNAHALNVLMTAQLSAAVESALAPPYVQIKEGQQVPESDEDKSPEQKEGEIPYVAGELKRAEAPSVQLERIADRLIGQAAPYAFQEALSGDATSDTSGHRLAIQVAQADLQLVPYQNARAEAIKELMMGILYAIRRHGLSIYIPTLPDGIKDSRSGKSRVATKAKLTPEMADLNFDLIVTLGSETPVTKYAKWQALRDREEAGTAGYQTVVEQSDTENPEEEIKRVFEGKMLKATMEQTIPQLAEMVAAAVKARFDAWMNPEQPQQEQQPELPFGAPPSTGLAAGGGAQPGIQMPLPGVGLPPAGPSTTDFGPNPVPMGGGEQMVSI